MGDELTIQKARTGHLAHLQIWWPPETSSPLQPGSPSLVFRGHIALWRFLLGRKYIFGVGPLQVTPDDFSLTFEAGVPQFVLRSLYQYQCQCIGPRSTGSSALVLMAGLYHLHLLPHFNRTMLRGGEAGSNHL
jgi:hypothetical protein